jgi:hypothetical protein
MSMLVRLAIIMSSSVRITRTDTGPLSWEPTEVCGALRRRVKSDAGELKVLR